MKKYIYGIIFGLLLVTTPVSAQTVDPQTQYIQALQQVIELLIQQVQQLMVQLAQVQAQQTQNTQVLGSIQANVTPTPVPTPVPTPSPVVEQVVEVKKEMIITTSCQNCPNVNSIWFYVAYLENGVNKEGVKITASSLNSNINPENTWRGEGITTRLNIGCEGLTTCALFRYIYNPNILDTVTITVNGLTKTYTFSSTTLNVLPSGRQDIVN